jgi:dolichol kinase
MLRNFLAWPTAAGFWILSVFVFAHTLANWRNPNKQRSKYSELSYGVFLIILGIYVLNLMNGVPDAQAILMYGILFGFIIAVLSWILIPNILFTYLRVKREPGLRTERSYEKFLKEVTERYASNPKEDTAKDWSRKILHFIQFSAIVIIHVACVYWAPTYADKGISAIAMRNFVYIFIASFFIFMFMVADLFRITRFEYLPDWAHKWYAKSLELRTETWSYNAAAPILLANLMFTPAGVPAGVLLSCTFISCVADALASIFGKYFGKHKLTHFGKYPHKSYEGLLAGALASALGVVVLLSIFPIPDISQWYLLICAIWAMAVFLYTDCFSTHIGDNVLNPVLAGSGFLLILLFF